MINTRVLLAAALAVAAVPASAATYTYVGNWSVYNEAAPYWYGHGQTGPLAYTAQEAAALLFGGNASDYVISSVGSDVDDIDNMAWYDIIGFGAALKAQDYFVKYLGQFYGPTSGYTNDGTGSASAFIRDNSVTQLNYAFRVSEDVAPVPVPAAMPLLLAGLGGMAVLRRRKGSAD